jgi:hypothetical protein
MMDRDAFLKLRVVHRHELPEGAFHSLAWTAIEREDFARFFEGKPDGAACEDFMAGMLVKFVCDEKGEKLFRPDDAAMILTQVPATVVDRLFFGMVDANKVSAAGVEEKKKG